MLTVEVVSFFYYKVDHEFHFILSCPLCNNLHSKFFANINKRYPNFNDLDTNLKITFFFNGFNKVDPFTYVVKTISCNLM